MAIKMEKSEITKESASVLYGVAYRFYQSGKYDEAENFFRFLTLTEPLVIKNWIGLGAALQLRKKYQEAIETYASAGILDALQENPLIPYYVAQCYHSLGKSEQGIKGLDAAEAMVTDRVKYQSLLSQVTFLRERWKEEK